VTSPAPFVLDHPAGVAFKVHVQPRSSRNQVVGAHGDALKVKLTAPPVEGAANAACIAFMAGVLDVPKSAVSIITGMTGRRKTLLIRCAPERVHDIRGRLEGLTGG
jgi:uncharacterized protein (TIGR00251 family)